jgi:hypothetical protein
MRRLSFRLPLAVLVIATALLVSACGSGSPSPSPTTSLSSGVQGAAVLEGGPFPGTPRPEPGIGIAVRKGHRDGPVVARTKADSAGAFSVDLAPGTYTLVEVADAAVPQTVRVEADTYVFIKLTIQAR